MNYAELIDHWGGLPFGLALVLFGIVLLWTVGSMYRLAVQLRKAQLAAQLAELNDDRDQRNSNSRSYPGCRR